MAETSMNGRDHSRTRRLRRLLAGLVALTLLIPAASGAAEPDYDGYVFRLAPGAAVLQEEAQGVEPVAPQAGIYRAESQADALAFAGAQLEYLEPNYYVTLLDSPTSSWGWEAVAADAAATAGLTGAGVRVGVVDSGIYAQHTALAGANIVEGEDFTQYGSTTDTLGHGTFVAGVIAGADWGLAPGVELVPLKCFTGRTGTLADAVSAIYAGVDKYHCDVLNMSLGIAQQSDALADAVAHAAEAGVVLVAAVGNAGTERLYYPAAYEGVLGVGSVKADLQPASATQHNASVDLTAPGDKIPGLGISGPEAWLTGSGTSYAAPWVTAAAALILEWNPELTPDEVAQLLCDGAVDLGPQGWDPDFGWGLLSVSGLVDALELQEELTLRQEEDAVCLRGIWSGLDADTHLWAVFYRGAALAACVPVTAVSVTAEGAVIHGELPIPEGADRFKLLALEAGSLIPAAAARELTLTH